MLKLSDERIRIGELWNALHDATELLDYYLREIYNGEMQYHKKQVSLFKKILWGDEKKIIKDFRDEQEIQKLHDEGMSIREIAMRLRMSKSSVGRKIKLLDENNDPAHQS